MRGIQKQLKKLKRLEQQRLNYHLESLGSAFCRSYGIDPKQAVLVEKDGKYWYELRDPAQMPETFRELFDLAVMLDKAINDKDAAGVLACQTEIQKFLRSLA